MAAWFLLAGAAIKKQPEARKIATVMAGTSTRESSVSKVSMMGTITCRDGMADEMAGVLAEMVEAARDEPGVEIYSYHRDEDDIFWFFALMSDAEAMQNHGQSEAMKAAMAAFGPLMAERPQTHVTTPIAALGFDL